MDANAMRDSTFPSPIAQDAPPAQFHGGQFHEVDLVETEVVRVERAYPQEGDEKNCSR